MDISKIVPSVVEADFPVGTKGFNVRLRYLSPGENRRLAREATDVAATAESVEKSFSFARHELLFSRAAVRGWKGLTAEAFAELVPAADIEQIKAQLPEGGEIAFDLSALKALMEHSNLFYDTVNKGCVALEEFRRLQKEEEIKNSAASPVSSLPPVSPGAPDAGN